MSKNDSKDVMGEIINDISSASDETVEEVQDTVEENQVSLDDALSGLREAVEAAQEQTEAPAGAETIIVKFDDDLEAAQALRIINKALRRRKDTIYQGAFVKRAGDDELEVEDFSKTGIADLVTGTAAVGLDLGKDGVKLAWTTAAAGIGFITGGIRLLRRTALSAAGLGGSTMTLRRRHKLDTFEPEEEVAVSTADLEPGETAVVIVADRETANELATDLVQHGGELA
ncbi:MAG: hypothetical protein ACK2U5_21650 [Candidatus Promineifilaceae bacterium]|jgi:hypothetical protein